MQYLEKTRYRFHLIVLYHISRFQALLGNASMDALRPESSHAKPLNIQIVSELGICLDEMEPRFGFVAH